MAQSIIVEALIASPSIQAAVVLVFISFAIRWYISLPPSPKFPKAELDDSDWHGSFLRAKIKYQNRTFTFGKNESRIILPNYLFEELKDLPDNQLSFRESANRVLLGKYTGLGQNIPPLAGSVKNELTKNINITLALLQDEIQYAVQENVGDLPAWTPVHIFGRLLRIVAIASSRVFVGRPLCRDEDWIQMTVNYTVDASNAVKEVQKIRPILRPFLVPFNKKVRRAADYRRRVAEKLRPELTRMTEAHKTLGDEDEDNFSSSVTEQHNLATWSLGHYEHGTTPTPESIADTLLAGSFAAIHTTTMTLTNVLYDLAAHPEYAVVLREEIERISAEEPDGKLRKKTMPKLRRLDSFIKESQRINPLGQTMLLRIVTAPAGIHLSNGDYLPHNSTIAVAQARQNSAIDPKFLSPMPPQPSLDEFHPWRFYDLRKLSGEENKHQFVTTTLESTVFGHGRWACPGRFFASNEIKAILIQLLMKYEIGVGPAGQGDGVGGKWKRPVTASVEMGYYPDPTASIYFRDRKI